MVHGEAGGAASWMSLRTMPVLFIAAAKKGAAVVVMGWWSGTMLVI
jgi:hypothetical protein